MKLQNHAYPRRFAVLGAVFAAALFGSVLLGRFSVTPKELFRLLLSRLTETEQGWRDGAENLSLIHILHRKIERGAIHEAP